MRVWLTSIVTATTSGDTALTLTLGPSSHTPCAPFPSSLSPLPGITYRTSSAPLAALSNWLRRDFNVTSRRGGRCFVLRVLVAQLGLSLPLIAKVVDDLLQPLTRISFAVSRGDNTTGRVDAKIFIQAALFIQRLRLTSAQGACVKKGDLRAVWWGRLTWLRFCIFWMIGNRSSSTLDCLHPSSCKRKLCSV